jgi:hypothetical protein
VKPKYIIEEKDDHNGSFFTVCRVAEDGENKPLFDCTNVQEASWAIRNLEEAYNQGWNDRGYEELEKNGGTE